MFRELSLLGGGPEGRTGDLGAAVNPGIEGDNNRGEWVNGGVMPIPIGIVGDDG